MNESPIQRNDFCNNVGGGEGKLIWRSTLQLATTLIVAVWLAPFAVANQQLEYQLTNRLAGWQSFSHTVKPNGFEIGIDPQVQYQGKPAALFTSTAPKQGKAYYVALQQEFKADAYKGKRLKFSAVTRGECSPGYVHLFVKINKNNRVLVFDNKGNRQIRSSSNWSPVSVVVDVPSDCTKITVGFDFRGEGRLWLSGLQLEAVGKQVPVTAVQQVDRKTYKFYENELPEKPRELNFERIAKERGPKQLLFWSSRAGQDRAEKEYEAFCDRHVRFRGKNSASIRSLLPEPKSFMLIDQDFSADLYVGARLRFRAFIKTENVKDWAGIFMRVDGVDQVLAFDNMEDRPVKGTTDWHSAAVILDVPPGAKRIRIGFMQAGAGQSWFSNCALDTMKETVNTTGEHIRVDKIHTEKLADVPKLDLQDR
jgi:hypothetical protein